MDCQRCEENPALRWVVLASAQKASKIDLCDRCLSEMRVFFMDFMARKVENISGKTPPEGLSNLDRMV